MKKITFLTLATFLFLTTNLNAQYCGPNLVPNPGLDTVTATCADPGYSTIMYYDTSPVKDWWGLCDTATARVLATPTPDYYHPNCTNNGTIMPDVGNNKPTEACPSNSGSISYYANNWEYVQTELIEPLKAGVEYELFIEGITIGFGDRNMGVWFETNKTNFCNFSVYTGSTQAISMSFPSSFSCSSSNVTYCAQGGETWIILGPETGFDAYTFDNISLRELCSITDFDPIITSSGTPDCIGSCVTLTADTANLVGGIDSVTTIVSYLWSTGDTTQNINVCPTVASVYSVDITVTKGCQSIIRKKSIDFCGAFFVDVSVDNQGICLGDSVTVSGLVTGGILPYTYVWTPNIGSGSGPYTLAPTTTTTYVLEATDSNGIKFFDSVEVIIHAIPNLNVSEDTTICLGEPNTLFASGAASYNWNPITGLSNPNIENPIANPNTTTTYTLTGTDTNDCKATDTVLIIVDSSCVVNINEQKNLSGNVLIYPNPSYGDMTVELVTNGNYDVKIDLFDIVGKKVGRVFSGNLNQGEQKIRIASGTHQKGIYFLSVEVGNERYLQKVVFY